jgi:hypothetical protein
MMLIFVYSVILAAPLPRFGTVVCASGTPERTAAENAIASLDRDIRSLRAAASVATIAEEFERLLRMPCLQFARNTATSLGASAASIRQWWDGGGETWLRKSLDGPTMHEGKLYVDVPPEPRRSMVREEMLGDPVAPSFVCPADEASCGAETLSWIENAEKTFRKDANAAMALAATCVAEPSSARETSDTEPSPSCEDADPITSAVITEHRAESRCASTAPRTRKGTPFEAWLACRMMHRARIPTLPVGKLRGAKRGWLVISGRRGHYDFCDELHAYDLDSGSVYIAASCSRLALLRGGSVDIQRTDASRALDTMAGEVSATQLRELLWALMIAPEIKSLARAQVFGVPSDIPVQFSRRDASPSGTSGHSWGSDAQTTLHWALLEAGVQQARGRITWPNSAHPGENYADGLLAVLEKTVTEKCPSAPVPVDLIENAPPIPGVSHIDATTEQLDSIQRTLQQALLGMRDRACGK